MSTLQTIVPTALSAGKVLLYRFPDKPKGSISWERGGEEYVPSQVALPITDPSYWEGRYTLCPLRIRVEDGSTLLLQDAVVSLTRTKQITTTQVVGLEGTVKEYISNGDYELSIQVGIQGTDDGHIADIYPEGALRELRRYLDVNKALQVQSAFLDVFEVNRIVVKSFSLTQDTASNYQELSITALSDNEYNVVSTDY
ncbi:DUF6046 domain-containing protein [uncultured Porphyromonas sp.]|uniref:DUF6046 domain-containing protein n=1 Tax=uncultured Porphyromonas sp. TaxID=159274 RepID=UPI0026340718|nr:DUF6046 domain-containing protein [uncultured Porphyromonas sp.]